jgi:hypothetical protein
VIYKRSWYWRIKKSLIVEKCVFWTFQHLPTINHTKDKTQKLWIPKTQSSIHSKQVVYVQNFKQLSLSIPFQENINTLLNLDTNLAKVLLIPLELISLLELLKSKDLLIDDRLDVVSLNSSIHLFKLLSAANVDTANSADVDESIEEGRLLIASATDETDDGNDTFKADGLEGLLKSVGTTDFDDVVYTHTAGDLLGGFAPVGVFSVVDDVVGTEGLEFVGLFLGGGGGDDTSTGCLCELESEDGNTASALGDDPVTGSQSLALETVETVPGGQASAGERSTLDEVEVAGQRDKTLLIVDTVLLEGSINDTASSGSDGLVVKRTGNVALVELSDDLVTDLEALDVLANGLDNTGTVRTGDDIVLLREWVAASGDDQISVVERSTVDYFTSVL